LIGPDAVHGFAQDVEREPVLDVVRVGVEWGSGTRQMGFELHGLYGGFDLFFALLSGKAVDVRLLLGGKITEHEFWRHV
jgi:hypothetical protein